MSWNYISVSGLSRQHKKPYLFQQFSHHIEPATDVVSVCPSMNKGLRALSLACYCSDTNGWIEFILNMGHLKTGCEKTSGTDSNILEFSQRKKKRNNFWYCLSSSQAETLKIPICIFIPCCISLHFYILTLVFMSSYLSLLTCRI